MKKKRIITILILVAVVIILVYSFMPAPLQVEAAKVRKETIYSYVEQRSETSLPFVYKATMPFDGIIETIKVKTGDMVKTGDTVVIVNQNTIKARIAETQAKINMANASINVLENNAIENTALTESTGWIETMKTIVAISKEKITASEAQLKYADQFKEAILKSGQGFSRIQDFDAIMKAAVSKQDFVQSTLETKAFELVHTIFTLAPVYINEYMNRKTLQKAVLLCEIEGYKATLSELNYQLGQTEIKSSVDGIVLAQYIKNNSFQNAGTDILDIGDMRNLEITSDVLTSDALGIKVGCKTEIYGGALGENNIIKGKVIQVEPQAFTKVSSLGVDEQRVNVKIALDKNQSENLNVLPKILGNKYRVYAKIFTAERNNALVIPRTALLKNNSGEWQVFAIKKSKAILTNVTVGIINDNYAEILTGLEASMEVVISPPSSLTNNSSVKY